ncbi:Sec-independent protein translocase protein TatB [Celeribacter sp.]|uniref:Sec-independent protein translocase protein TatB n=1 Tax=Celeribacter sp. TaxID=1890673 RepID=UPI003A8F80D9
MLDIGMSELLVIGIVSLIVVGPKDLPGMFRTLGRFTARAKSMAREFSSAMDAAADESGIKEASAALKGAANPKKFGLDKLNEAADEFDKWDPMEKIENPAVKKTAALDPNRAEMAKIISEATAKKANERLARDAKVAAKAAEAASAKPSETPATPQKPVAKKTAARKPAAKKPAAKKTAAAKAAPAKAPAKKPAAKPAAKTAAKAAPKSTKTKKGDA